MYEIRKLINPASNWIFVFFTLSSLWKRQRSSSIQSLVDICEKWSTISLRNKRISNSWSRFMSWPLQENNFEYLFFRWFIFIEFLMVEMIYDKLYYTNSTCLLLLVNEISMITLAPLEHCLHFFQYIFHLYKFTQFLVIFDFKWKINPCRHVSAVFVAPPWNFLRLSLTLIDAAAIGEPNVFEWLEHF